MEKLYKDRFDEEVVKWQIPLIREQEASIISLQALYTDLINRTSVIVNDYIDESYRKYRVGRADFNEDTINRPLTSFSKYVFDYCVELGINTEIDIVKGDLKKKLDEKYIKLIGESEK